MVEVKRTVKVVTEQSTIPGRAPEVEGFPMKLWSIEIFLLDEAGNQIEANIFSKATYNLHASFANPTQTFEKPPFRCQNEGWGEFDLTIDLHAVEKGGKHTIAHDLNFAQPRYEAKHVINFKNPNPNLLDVLRKSGPVPDDANGARKKGGDADARKKKKTGQVDMDRLADGLVKLQEDDLLQVVQMIHDNKSDETYTKNDVDQGEFHVDLYTLPDALVRMLWDFVQSKA
ncbi:hypothetical protein VC83_05669 [Pseudogymnoascus destructans]|uniref:YEATS domain-containing protein n=3 Tax=Pseudogymnoascus TaxID=78156 RepID=A0A1B8GW58_9PEZI|nr:uncharacterized protein VE01_01779 [Pseudogymnoascus verrucosus]XP_024323108.1 uncharacterized protein VC83_05669 [Pseudogymnoascus destructans]ELR06951.1 hypothetical protein GMDG_08185 [Pseudogymnoascus destructans 20631-21]KFY81116.1 hypothetical protein V499_00110 [Pseudogymnoascus sp. VKM F-103]KFZ08489.1 hypothetical protein V501_05951 [Pseudogymnoascus sp. VKM F-4519 (FW-2642)]OBT48883.1 hypothetical protein VE00_00711 [Pseudogymnoascus sp. WSF 3629]OBT90636.1 hypothetical protein V